MKEKKNHTGTAVLFAVIFCLLYTILALRPLSTELHFSPEWTENILHTQKNVSSKDLIAYRCGQNIGYFTPEGKIASTVTFPFKASISDTYYTTYSAGNTEAEIYSPDGELKCVIKDAGFPFIDEDRLFLMLPGGSAFAHYDINGNEMWQYESYSVITAFSSSKEGIVAGFADGTIAAFTKDGSLSQKFVPGGSEKNIILGAAISDDGNTVACISGQNKQRLVVALKNGEHSKIIYHEYLEKDLHRQTLVKFKGNTVYYNYNGGIGIVDLNKTKSYKVPLEGTVSQIEFSPVSDLTFVLSRQGKNYTVTVLEPFNKVAGSFSFTADNAFIRVKDDGFYIGRDNKISKIQLSRK